MTCPRGAPEPLIRPLLLPLLLLLLASCGAKEDSAALSKDERAALRALARAVGSAEDPERVLPPATQGVVRSVYGDLKRGRFGFRSQMPEAAVIVALSAASVARMQERVLAEMDLTRASAANEPPDSPRAQRVKALLATEADDRAGLAANRAKVGRFTQALEAGDLRAAFADY